jgi:hypothetical protein
MLLLLSFLNLKKTNMKKTAVLFILSLGLTVVSCKKDRTCECTYSNVSGTSTNPNYVFKAGTPSVSSNKYTKVKKSNDAIKNCVSSESTNSYSQSAFNGTATVVYDYTMVSKNDCKVK